MSQRCQFPTFLLRCKQRPDGSLAQVPSEEINQAFMLLIFCVGAEPMPFSLIKMYFGSSAMLLQSFP
jgi:hypothetical protein